MKSLIIVKPKSLSPSDKAKLTKAGNVVIEHEDASQVVVKDVPVSEYVFTNCSGCGERIYMLPERLETLKKNGKDFYCNHGHRIAYAIH